MTVADPVCGAEIDVETAAAREDRDGWLYFFCSIECHRRFKADPDRYSPKKVASGA